MRICLVIPVYNCDPVIAEVVDSVLSVCKLPLIVIDDGSDQPVSAQIKDPRVQIIRLEKNAGKGAALQRALIHCAELQFSHMITFDGDGQHLAADIVKIEQAVHQHPQAIIIGCRKFQENVPGSSRFGRSFSNFWVKYQTGFQVQDSQSGLRAYPVQPFKSMVFFTKRYDFEIEILVRGLWRGIPVKEIPVDVHYPDRDLRISHFHKFKDNVRITALMIALITYSLLFQQKSGLKVVVVGILAFVYSLISSWWAAIFLALLTCVVLRLNAILMLVCLILLKVI